MPTLDPVQLYDDLCNVRRDLRLHGYTENVTERLRTLSGKCAELAAYLNRSNIHSAELLENRRCSPDDPNFYKSIHAMEELLTFAVIERGP